MSTVTTSLVISSQTPFDVEKVTAALNVAPTEIWRRKPGIKVHGIDTIPLMSWVFERTEEATTGEEAIQALCDLIPGFDTNLRSITLEMNLKTSLVCRVRSQEILQEIDLSASMLGRLSSNALRLVWSAEFESDPGKQA